MGKDKDDLLYPELTYRLRGIFYDIYNKVGPGYKEKVYFEALRNKLKEANIPFEGEVTASVFLDTKLVGRHKIDLIIDKKVIIEVKSVLEIHPQFKSQLVSYLRATGLKLGFLVNFGGRPLEIVIFRNTK